MNFDDRINEAWQAQRPSHPIEDLKHRVHRQALRQRLWRALEVSLTLAAIAIFGKALLTGEASAKLWLLLPFYAVYLPLVWTMILKTPRTGDASVLESTHVYAQRRMTQLRAQLRDVWMWRIAGWSLLGYTVIAAVAVWLLADESWREAAGWLLTVALIVGPTTELIARRVRRRVVREYRGVRRLVDVTLQA